jgi:hypothetical protein
LRWWSEIKEDGTEEWVFESLDISKSYQSTPKTKILTLALIENTNPADNRIFWFTCYATPIIWVIFGIVGVLSFKVQNVTVCLLGFALSVVNLLGYIKCEKNHKQKVKGYLYDQAKNKLTAEQMLKIGQTVAKYSAGGSGQP